MVRKPLKVETDKPYLLEYTGARAGSGAARPSRGLRTPGGMGVWEPPRGAAGKGSWGKLRDNLTCTVVKEKLAVQSTSVFDHGLGGRLRMQAHLIAVYAHGQILDLAALGSRAVHEFGNASRKHREECRSSLLHNVVELIRVYREFVEFTFAGVDILDV